MITVKKTRPGKVDQTVNATQMYWLNKAAKEGRLEECIGEPSIAALLKTMHENGLWLICDCQPSTPLEESPGMGVVNRGGKLFLRNLPSRREHAKECPFRYTKSLETNKRGSGRPEIKGPLNLHLPDNVTSVMARNDETKPSGHSPSSRESKLATLLFQLLDQAGGLKFTPDYEFRYVLDGIRKAALTMEAWSGTELNSVLELSPQRINAQAMKIKKLRENKYTGAYGIFIGIFHRVEERNGKPCLIREVSRKQPEGQVVELAGKLDILSSRSISKGPFLALFTQAPSPGETFVKPQKGVIIPAASTLRPIPVESELERRVFIALQDYIELLSTKGIAELTLYKPMQDYRTAIGDCRPDFLITGKKGTAVVECMGMTSDPGYLERKKHTHPVMAQLGQVVEIHTLSSKPEQEKAQLNELKRAVKAITC